MLDGEDGFPLEELSVQEPGVELHRTARRGAVLVVAAVECKAPQSRWVSGSISGEERLRALLVVK